jgi:hypothetical protein
MHRNRSLRGIVDFGMLVAWTAVVGIETAAGSPSSAIRAQTSQEMVLRAGPTGSPPVIDADLGDACWREATMASGYISLGGDWARPQTTGFVTYDDTCLYLAFHCHEPAVEKISAAAKNEDDAGILLGDDDHLGLFLDTNHDRASYYRLALTSKGAVYEAACEYGATGLRSDKSWNPEWEVKTAVGSKHWTAEIRIAFASLGVGKPEPGTIWGVNLLRTRRAPEEEHSTWAGVADRYQPKAFGRLVFGKPADVSYSILSMGDRETDYELRLRLRNATRQPIQVRSVWSSLPAAKDKSAAGVTTPLEPKEQQDVTVACQLADQTEDVPLGLTVVVPAMLSVVNHETEQVYDARKGVLHEEAWLDLALDRYYYTPDVHQMQIAVTNRTKQGSAIKIEVTGGPDEGPVATKDLALSPDEHAYPVSFDIADWPVGRYVDSAHVVNEAAAKLFSIHRVMIKKRIQPARMPASGGKVSIRSDGILLLNGKPFCPFFTTPGNQSPLATDCFNVRYGETALVSNPLDQPKIGLPWVTIEKGEILILLPEEKEMLEGIRRVVASRKSDPSILCWLIKYEAQYPLCRGTKEERVRLNNVEEFRKIRRHVKSVDPNHLTSIHTNRRDLLATYKDLADVIEVTFGYEKRMIPNKVDHLNTIRRLIGPGKPFIHWIGSSIPNSKYRTAEDIRCATYLTLMHGAAGIVFHIGHEGIDPSFTRHWSVYPGLSREVEELFSILTAPQQGPEPKITVHPAQIHYRVRRTNDRLYLIAVNTLGHLVNATVSMADRSLVPKRIKLPFENRQIKPQHSGFADAFTAYEPHVYEWVSSKGEGR